MNVSNGEGEREDGVFERARGREYMVQFMRTSADSEEH